MTATHYCPRCIGPIGTAAKRPKDHGALGCVKHLRKKITELEEQVAVLDYDSLSSRFERYAKEHPEWVARMREQAKPAEPSPAVPRKRSLIGWLFP